MKEKKDKSINLCLRKPNDMYAKVVGRGRESGKKKDRATRDNLFFKTLDYSWRERWETSERKKKMESKCQAYDLELFRNSSALCKVITSGHPILLRLCKATRGD